jgi:hypothetical protein
MVLSNVIQVQCKRRPTARLVDFIVAAFPTLIGYGDEMMGDLLPSYFFGGWSSLLLWLSVRSSVMTFLLVL